MRRGRGITILELLIVIATLMALASLLLPAVQAAREATRNAECKQKLHQISLGLQAYQDAHRVLPAGWLREASNESSYGWAAAILSELDESSLSAQINHSSRIPNLCSEVRKHTPKVYLCPSDPGEPAFSLYAEIGEHGSHAQQSEQVLVTLPRASYVGVFGTIDPDDVPGNTGDGIFIEGRGQRVDDVSRGASHLMLVGERTTRKLPSTWLGIAN
jgi:type II secretory pathway pseudopilin PulG